MNNIKWFKQKTKKIKTLFVISAMMPFTIVKTYAKTPTFDNTEAQTAAQGFLSPLTTFALWAIPLVTTVVLLVQGIMWMGKDEDEKEQKPFIKTAKKILIVAIILECLPVLLKIFGIS